MKRNSIVTVSMLILVVIVAAYAMKSKKINVQDSVKVNAQQTLRFISPTNLQDVTFINDFTRDKGFYAKNNLVVQDIAADKDFTNLLLSGAGDVVISSYTGSMAAYFNNAQVRGLGGLSHQFRSIGVSRFPREKVQMIKKVAVDTLAGDPVSVMKNALKNIGVDPYSVEISAVPAVAAREAMLASGDLDFIILSSQQNLDTLDSSKNFTIYQTEEITKNANDFLQIYTLQNKITEKPLALQDFVTSLYESLQYADNDPVEVKEYLMQKYGFSQEVAQNFYDRYLTARKDVSLIPSNDLIKNISDKVKGNASITSDRDPIGFLYTDFAKIAQSVK